MCYFLSLASCLLSSFIVISHSSCRKHSGNVAKQLHIFCIFACTCVLIKLIDALSRYVMKFFVEKQKLYNDLFKKKNTSYITWLQHLSLTHTLGRFSLHHLSCQQVEVFLLHLFFSCCLPTPTQAESTAMMTALIIMDPLFLFSSLCSFLQLMRHISTLTSSMPLIFIMFDSMLKSNEK